MRRGVIVEFLLPILGKTERTMNYETEKDKVDGRSLDLLVFCENMTLQVSTSVGWTCAFCHHCAEYLGYLVKSCMNYQVIFSISICKNSVLMMAQPKLIAN